MPIVVVGGTGYLGRAVTRAAQRRGHEVRAASSADIDLRRPIAPLDADVVVNCAYVQHGPGLQTVTVEGAVALAHGCTHTGARLVQLSTDLVFAGRPEPYTPTDPPDPLDDYGRAKVAMERGVLVAAPHALIVRTSLLWGAAEPGPQERLVIDACQGAPIRFFTTEVRCPIEVDDLAARLLDDIDAPTTGSTPRRGIVHEAGGEAIDRLALARRIARRLGLDPTALRGGVPDPAAPPRPGCVILHP